MNYLERIYKKANDVSPAVKASFWFIVSNIVLKGISFITTPIFTRILEVKDYGTTSIYITWEGIISIFATLNLAGGVYNVAMTRYPEDIDGYTSSMYAIETLISSVIYGSLLVINKIYPNIFDLSNILLIFMWLQSLTNSFTSFWLMRHRFNYKYKPVVTYTIINALVSPMFAIITILQFPDNAAISKIVGSSIFGIAFGFGICIKGFIKGKKLYSKEYWLYALKFNIPLIPHYLSSVLLNGADRLMIDRLISRVNAGIYSIANSVSGVLTIVTSAINSTLIPETLKAVKSRDFSGLRKNISLYLSCVSVICITIMMFGREAIILLASKKYVSAIPYVPPLLISTFFLFATGIVGNIIFYYEKTWMMSFTTIVTAMANIILNYFALQKIGSLAASYTTLITSVMGFILTYFFARSCEKEVKQIINLRYFLFNVMILCAFAICSISCEKSFVIRCVVMICFISILWYKRSAIFKNIDKTGENLK